MRTLHNFIALLAGTFAGIGALMLKFDQLAQRPDDLLVVLGWIGAAAAVVYCASRLLLAAAAVRLRRGPGYVAWVRPSECTSFSAWLTSDWRFFGKGGQQEGTRFLGVEIAFAGTLG